MIRHASEPTPWVKKPERKNTGFTAVGPHSPGQTAVPIPVPVDKAAVAFLNACSVPLMQIGTLTLLNSPGLRPTLKTHPPSDIAIEDCDILFNAVKARLSLTVGERLVTTPELQRLAISSQVQTSVLECMAALDQLHMTLMNELGRRQHLELEVFDAKAALAQARAELVGIQTAETQYRQRSRVGSRMFPAGNN